MTSWSTGPSRSTGRFRYTSNFHIQDWSSSADTIMAEARTQEELTAELDDLRKKLDTFEAAQRQQAAAAAASAATAASFQNVTVTQANIASKFLIDTPCFKEKMSFEDYKHDVLVWQSFVENHLPKSSHGQALVNRLPSTDPKMIKRTIIERIGLDGLKEDGAVDKILDEMAKILQPEKFARLVEWMRRWETLSQGSMDYDKFTLKLRHLAKQGKEEFDLVIPQNMMVAKLLLAANDVKSSNIGLLTHDCKLERKGRDNEGLYDKLEGKLRTLIGTTSTFSQVKPATSVFTASASFVSKDLLGNPMSPVETGASHLSRAYCPEDEAEERFMQTLSAEEATNYIAFKRSRQAGFSDKSRYPMIKKQDDETFQQRKARCMIEGKCFQEGCESKDHKFADCPIRAAHKEDLRKRLGAKFIEDPIKLKEHREAQKLKKRKNFEAAHAKPPSSINYQAVDENQDEIIGHVQPHDVSEEEELIMDSIDEIDAKRVFKTARINITEYKVDGKYVSVNFTREQQLEALLDSGAERSCSGPEWYEAYVKALDPSDRALVQEYVGTAKFKFGGAGIYTSMKECLVPIWIVGRRKFLKLDVVQTDIPLLLGLPIMKSLNMCIQYTKAAKEDIGIHDGIKFKIAYRQGHHFLPITKAASRNSIIKDSEMEGQPKIYEGFINKVRVFDEDKLQEQLKQLHVSYGHIPKERLIQILRSGDAWKPEMSSILDQVMEQCATKRCREKVHCQGNVKAAFKKAEELGEIVSCDLKIRENGRHILYFTDYATSFCVATFIEGKSAKECSDGLIRAWFSAGFPAIKILVNDNGLEFAGADFANTLQRTAIVQKFSTPFHPNMCGFVERVHAVVDLNMSKLQEANEGLTDDRALTWAVMAYNNTPTFTGFSPCQMTFGVKNVLRPVQEMSLAECEQTETDRYLDDFKLRSEAIANHNKIRNSRKLRETVIARSRPTKDRKPCGMWVWFQRDGCWRGPAQVAHSLAGEASVKFRNRYLNCRHAELLPLNLAELQAHNLDNDGVEREEQSDTEQQVDPPGPEEVTAGQVEIEGSILSIIPRSLSQASPSSGNNESDSFQSNNSVDSDPDTSPKPARDMSPGLSDVSEITTHSEPVMMISPPQVTRSSSAPPQVQQPSPVTPVQATEQMPTLPPGFSPELATMARDVRTDRLRSGDKVRLFHPSEKVTLDVTITNGHPGRKNQLSWYSFRRTPKSKKETLDFNDIIWEERPKVATNNLVSINGQIQPFKINHQIIHPRMHHMPGVINAKADEIKSHERFGTFELVDEITLTPEQKENIISSTWAVVWKGTAQQGKFKARLCARGDLERGADQLRTDAPTSSKDFIRILLSIAASKHWLLHSLDFSSAFVQGKNIDRELFLKPPPDVRRQNPGKLFKVIKRLYGLKDASRGWCQEIADYLISLGCEQSSMDKAIFYMKDKGELIGIVCTHIDDLLYSGTDKFHRNVIEKVKQKYVIGSVEDTAMTFTGWQLKQTEEGIRLSQETYHEGIHLEPFQHFSEFSAKDEQILGENDQTLYRKLVGTLNWMSSTSKPGLAHACNSASTKLGKAKGCDAKAAFRILSKAKLEPETILFSNLGNPKTWTLDVFCDAALGKVGQTPDTFIGDITFFRSKDDKRNVINWASGKLDIPTVGILSGEAESVVNSYGKVKYLRYIFNELFDCNIPANIYTDSRSLQQTVSSDNSIRNRRISAAVATIRAVKTKENISLIWVKGLENLSDPLTKANANCSNLKSVLSTGRTLPQSSTKEKNSSQK